MLNLMNLISSSPQQTAGQGNQGEVSPTSAGSGQTGESTGMGFFARLQAVIGENQEASGSVGEIDSEILIENMVRQGNAVISELLLLLQSAQLMEIPDGSLVLPDNLDIMSLEQLQEILASLQKQVPNRTSLNVQTVDMQNVWPGQLLEAWRAAPESQSAGQESLSFLSDVIDQALDKCEQAIEIRKLVLESQNGFAQASYPEEIAVDLPQDKQTVKAEIPAAKDVSTAPEAAPGILQKARLEIEKVFAVFKELNASMESAESNGANGRETGIDGHEELKAEGLFALARLLHKGKNLAVNRAQSEKAPEGAIKTLGADAQKVFPVFSQSTADKTEARSFEQVNVQDGPMTGVEKEMEFLVSSLGQTENQAGGANEIRPDSDLSMPRMERVVLRQLIDRIQIFRHNGTQEIRIRLDPPELGHVHLKLEMEGPTVTARFTVENAGVKQTVENGFAQLRQSLSDQGFKVDRLDVRVGYGFEQPGQNKNVQDQWAMRKGWSHSGQKGAPYAVNSVQPDLMSLAYGLDTGRRYGYNTVELYG